MFRFYMRELLNKRFGDNGDDGTGGDTGTGTGGTGAGTAGAAGGTNTGGTGEIKLTAEQQKHVDKIINARFAKTKSENENLVRQLEVLKKKEGMTAQEKADIETQVERLKSEYLTKEEVTQREYKTTVDRLTGELNTTKETAEKANKRFEQYLVRAELVRAASEAKAYRAGQVVDMFGSRAKVVQKMDADGKPIPEEFEVKVTLHIDGKTLEVTPGEGMKLLKGSPDYANLFAAEGSGGLGGSASGSTGELDKATVEKWLKDPEQYAKNRDKILAFMNKGQK